MPPRLNMDRIDKPLGGPQRPLLKAAMTDPQLQEPENKILPTPHSAKEAGNRRDSTENPSFSKKELVSQTAKLVVSSLTRILPIREPPKTSSKLWECILVELKSNNFELAQKLLWTLYKHPSTSKTAFVNRRRALSILAGLVTVDEWSRKTPLCSRNSQLISAGIAHGSPDAIAFGSWFYLKKRWSSSFLSFEHMVDLLVGAARRGHAACQAVLGIMLSTSSKLSGSNRRLLRKSSQPLVLYQQHIHQKLNSGLHSPANIDGHQKHEIGCINEGKVNRSIQLLKEAASKGYFLALDQIEREMQKNTSEKTPKQRVHLKAKAQQQCISPHEFFSCVQNAANQQVPYCVVRLAELLENGIGCEKSEEDARLWLRTAANLNVPVAMIEIHARTKNENRRVTATLKRQFLEKDFYKENSLAEERRANATLKQNTFLLRQCEESISRWQAEQEQHKTVLAFHIISNLSSRISDNMSSAVLHFIFEREKKGWL
ncbi:unnamed protein product [Agarophyton chilense]|eukprot:gb/GEZJ01000994.1/.p1 GENE.gb/GEZJ01000994.1/~~gb/GEZJ01000994.1/.p1  ORF type:complete len:487 (-),score=71.07 gb/GEZJ01000994.1/:2106-3566(-)